MKIFCLFIILLVNPAKILCQYDSTYYKHRNYGYKYYEEGEYEKSIQSFSLIPDSLFRSNDFIVLINMYSNRDDITNLKKTIVKYSISNNSCEEIYNANSLKKYRYLIGNICHNQFDILYKAKYSSIHHVISYLDSSVMYSNKFRSKKSFDTLKFSLVDKHAYSFFTNCNMKEIATAYRYVIQKDKTKYTNLFLTLIHMNYYDNVSSVNVEKWAKELMYYGILEPKDFAYIVDRRIDLIGDKKQKYGTHFWNYNLQELIQINKNRADIGLLPIN